jgi:hypothetical protein
LLEVEQEAGDGVEIAIAHTWIYKGQDVLGKFFGTKLADSPTQRSMSKGISRSEMVENVIKACGLSAQCGHPQNGCIYLKTSMN